MPIQVVGRRRELELVRAALASGAHILIEGPPGTGKSTLLRQAGLDAALTTLSGRVRRHESCRRSADEVIEEIFRSMRAASPDPAGGDTSPGE